ncbi:hypothetical protein [Paenibacillus sp. SYP-B3998]|uniref:hypothetical protein n=1 Tax=Paenibacillus sp. SYP-B3998 TaxID=2678564 RepID=UPI001F087165|nr:hypothetical protein [Paenibacillus sp. SYP-B3998]
MKKQNITLFPFLNGDVLYSDEVFIVAINANLSEDRRVMVLESSDGRVMAVLTPALAYKLGIYQREDQSEPIFRRNLNEAGVTLHGADYLFYFVWKVGSDFSRLH